MTLSWAQRYAQSRYGPYRCKDCGPILVGREPLVDEEGSLRCPNLDCDALVRRADSERSYASGPNWQWSQPETIIGEVFESFLDTLESPSTPNSIELASAIKSGHSQGTAPSELFALGLKDVVDEFASRRGGRLIPLERSTYSLQVALTSESDLRGEVHAPGGAVEVLAHELRDSVDKVQQARQAEEQEGATLPPLESTERLIELIRKGFAAQLGTIDPKWRGTLLRELGGPFSRAMASCKTGGRVTGQEPCESCGAKPGKEHRLVSYNTLRGAGARSGSLHKGRKVPAFLRKALPKSLHSVARFPVLFGLLRVSLSPLPQDVANYSRSEHEADLLNDLLFGFHARTDMDGRGDGSLARGFVEVMAKRAASKGPQGEPPLISKPTAAALLEELVVPFLLRSLERTRLPGLRGPEEEDDAPTWEDFLAALYVVFGPDPREFARLIQERVTAEGPRAREEAAKAADLTALELIDLESGRFWPTAEQVEALASYLAAPDGLAGLRGSPESLTFDEPTADSSEEPRT